MKNQQQQPKQTGSVYIQFLEKRSIPLYREDERPFINLPINIDRTVFAKTKEEKNSLAEAKAMWKLSIPPNYKPTLLARA